MRLQPLNRFGRWGVFQQPASQFNFTRFLDFLFQEFTLLKQCFVRFSHGKDEIEIQIMMPVFLVRRL